jgi:peptidoglycan/LPS O-acetylase OafA/YrhL
MKNNFDFLRLVFALLVVISHSYPLSGNSVTHQFLYEITNGQIELSNIGLNGFFVISGYLIYQSLERSKTIINYLWKRVIRLFPALFVVLLLTVILIPFVYHNSLPYIKNKEVFTYFVRNLTLYDVQYAVKGVFDNNVYPSAINGSLWTICYEFTMYLLLVFLFYIKNIKVKIVLLLLTLVFMIFSFIYLMDRYGLIQIFGMQAVHFFNLGSFFVAGAFLSVLKIEKVNFKPLLLVLVLIFIIVSLKFNFYQNVKHILFTLFVILLGLIPNSTFSKINLFGDLSYGIYIYGFPIQQTLMYFFKLSTYSLMAYSVLTAIFFGYLSWHLIEKKMLFYKNKF